MKVTVQESGPCRRVLTIVVPPEEVQPHYDSVLRDYVAKARLPGFRPGKSPPALVESRFRRRILRDVEERMIPQCSRQAFQEQKIEPLAVVETDDVDLSREKGLQFRVTVDVAPSFELPKYEKLSLKGRIARVEDEEVNRAVQNLRERFGRYAEFNHRPLRQGDLALVDYHGQCEGKPIAELAPHEPGLDRVQDFWMLVQEASPVPGLAPALAGMTVGEEREVTVSFPAEFSVAALTGKTAVYRLRVRAARERIPAELTPELLRRFGVDSEEALRNQVRENLKRHHEAQEKARLKHEIVRFLMDRVHIDLPASLVDREARKTVRSIVNRIAQEGGTIEDVEKQKDDIFSAAATSAVERLKLRFLLDRIAEEQHLRVEDEDLNRRIESLAREVGLPPEEVRARLDKRKVLDDLKQDIRMDKTLDFLLQQARIKWED